jgi:hypothetical protein
MKQRRRIYYSTRNSNVQFTPAGEKSSIPLPFSARGTICSITTWPKPRRCGGTTGGPPFSHQWIRTLSPALSTCHRINTSPRGPDPRVAAHVPSDRRLGDLEAELEQLTMNTRRTPKCVRTAHLANERAQLSRDLRSANTVAGSPAPIRPKPSTVPANDGFRPDDRNRLKEGRKPAIEPNK